MSILPAPNRPHRPLTGRVARALLCLAVALSLPACGRVGPVRAKGPQSEIVYPRAYPYTPAARSSAPNATPAPSPMGQGELPMERPGIVR